jgi:hypothetical protein
LPVFAGSESDGLMARCAQPTHRVISTMGTSL